MHDLHAIACPPQILAHFLGDHDGTVLPTGTAESDRQIALAFVDVVRQQEEQIGISARDELASLRK